jgi:hypothetical protein|tara:strand:+ start:769 stop:1158 length:390 start_codon:yes stop_codon:yes gene_type:complete
MELDMKKDIDSKDIISEGTLHEILLDIKYRLDHIEDMEADNRALMVKLVKQTNSIVKFLSDVEIENVYDTDEDMGLPPVEKNQIYDSEKTEKLRRLIDEFMDKKEELKEFEKELKKNKEMLTPGQVGES